MEGDVDKSLRPLRYKRIRKIQAQTRKLFYVLYVPFVAKNRT